MSVFKRFYFVIMLFVGTAYGQLTINNAVVTNPPITSCTTTFLTVSGFHNYAGYTYTGSTVNIVGATINVTLNYTFGIGLPTITPFTQNVDIGTIPPGSYTALINGTVNGTPYGNYSIPLVSVPCCGAVASFVPSATTVCLGELVQFTNTSTGSISQAWVKDGIPVGSSLNYSFIASNLGSNVVSLAVTNGTCFDSVSVTIDVLSVPSVDSLSVNTSNTCFGKVLVLTSYSNGSSGTSGMKWFKNGVQIGTGQVMTAIASSIGTNTYSFVATNNYCSDTMDILVEVFASPTITNFSVSPTNLCLGDTVVCSSNVTNSTSVNWKLNNVISGTGNSYTHIPSTAGNYQYKLVASNPGCADSSAQNVTVNPAAISPNLGLDTNLCLGSIILDAGTATSYLWNDGSVGQFLTVNTPGTYWVTILNSNGCSASDSIVVESCVGLFEIKKSWFNFGPNPVHDKLLIEFDFEKENVNIDIYTATGQLIISNFHRHTKNIELNTESLDEGIYFVNIRTNQNSESIKLVK